MNSDYWSEEEMFGITLGYMTTLQCEQMLGLTLIVREDTKSEFILKLCISFLQGWCDELYL